MATTSLKSQDQEDPRMLVARLRNCISALAINNVLIFDTTIMFTYEASLKFEVSNLCAGCDCDCLVAGEGIIRH